MLGSRIAEVPTQERAPSLTDGTPLVRVDLNEQVYYWVRERLLTRQLGPGERLRLQSLADELGVSRSPVQHALTRLVTEGLVTSSRQGYAVRPLTAVLMEETHDARVALELFAAEEAIGRIDAEDRRRLRAALEATIRPVRDGVLIDKRAYLLANQAFHEQIVDLGRNTVISELYRRLNVHRLMERAYLAVPMSAAGNSSAEHTEIVEALEADDLDRARVAIRANAETGKRLAVQAIEIAGGVL
jgi:DNA-binding GntR family transcriptional regulator